MNTELKFRYRRIAHTVKISINSEVIYNFETQKFKLYYIYSATLNMQDRNAFDAQIHNILVDNGHKMEKIATFISFYTCG